MSDQDDSVAESQRYTRIRELFMQVCELDALERSAILDSACADDAALRNEVESLLREDSHASGIVGEHHQRQRMVVSLVGSATVPAVEALPCLFGRYRLLRVLGEGGMGTVYEAEQVHPHRLVALKVLRPGVTTAAMLRRFEHEAHVLGLLHHPGIAQIFEAGAADRGQGEQPFFVMELVRGQPLLKYAAEHDLPVRQKLELMARICDAVQHAHTKGVVHRDLKPNNIVVEETGQPKILDFGVARATDCDIQTTTLHTQVGQLVGTLAYMSPEQAGGNPDDVDTRSDVYSLGVICFELLSGRLPLDLDRKPLHEAVRMIREQDPPKLDALDRAFRGDIETIVAKAMEKEPRRRYQSVAEFSSDIRSSLRHEMIVARPASMIGQLRRFTARNRLFVAAVFTIVATLVIAVAGTTYGLREALQERNLALEARELADRRATQLQSANEAIRRERDRSTSVLDFVRNMLSIVDPEIGGGSNPTLREVVDQAAHTVKEDPPDDASIRATIQQMLGEIYFSLAAYEQGEEHMRAALAVRQRELGDANGDTASSMLTLARLLRVAGRPEEAAPLIEQAVNTRESLFGADHEQTIIARNDLASNCYATGQLADAERLYRLNYELCKARYGDTFSETATMLGHLGRFLSATDNLQEAETVLRAAYDKHLAIFSPDSRHTLVCAHNLGVLLIRRGKADEAESLFRMVVAIQQRKLGELHPDTLKSQLGIVQVLNARGQFESSRMLAEQILADQTSILGKRHPNTLDTKSSLAIILQKLHRYEEAESMFREILESRWQLYAADHQEIVTSLSNVGTLLGRLKRYHEAEGFLNESVTMGSRIFPPTSWRLAQSKMNYAGCLLRLQRYEEAEPHILSSIESLEKSFGRLHDRTQIAYQIAFKLYERWGKPEQAERIRPFLRDAVGAAIETRNE